MDGQIVNFPLREKGFPQRVAVVGGNGRYHAQYPADEGEGPRPAAPALIRLGTYVLRQQPASVGCRDR
jgi:hypothetical protein